MEDHYGSNKLLFDQMMLISVLSNTLGLINPQSGLTNCAKRSCCTVGGRRAAQGPQKLWGKWCNILHSGILPNSNLTS
jgi:hypothetical protein